MTNRLTSKALALLLLCGSLIAVAAQEKDWIEVAAKDGSVRLQVPPSFVLDDPNDPRTQANFEKIKQNNPDLAKKMSAGASAKDQLLVCFDMNDTPTDGMIDTFNVIHQPLPGGIPNKDLGMIGKEVLKAHGGKGKKESKVVDLPFGKAVNYWMEKEMVFPDGTAKTLDLMGYLFSRGDKMYVVTFMTGHGQLKEKRALYEKIMKSAKF